MAEILILGTGFGGITAALELQSHVQGAHRITLVDQKSHFVMGLAKLWALDGRRPIEAGRRPLDALKAKGIHLVRGRVEKIDLDHKTVLVGTEALRYDYLILALGAETDPHGIPGFESVYNLYDETSVTALAKALQTFAGGRVLLFVTSTPFKCPPAPYEAAMLISSYLHKRGLEGKLQMRLTTPEPHPLPVAPSEYGDKIMIHLTSHSIDYQPGQKPKAVHGAERVVEYESSARHNYHLAIGVPVHRAPAVVRAAGLVGPSGWIPVDPHTFATQHANVWAVGDVAGAPLANGKALPKAGVLAEGQARVVAQNLAAMLHHKPHHARFDGKGTCFIELGSGNAIEAEGDFYASPQPRFTFKEPGEEGLAAKRAFEADRLRAWFGS